jgi:ankyrin repeat protein
MEGGSCQRTAKECADINACNAYGGNALYAAYFRCDETIVRLLLENGPTVSANHGLYSTASRAAAYGGHEAIVRLFWMQGQTPTCKVDSNNAVLAAAAKERRSFTVVFGRKGKTWTSTADG